MIRSGCRRMLPVLFLLLLACGPARAATFNLPAWYDLTLTLDRVPEVGKPLVIIASFTPRLGAVERFSARFVLPEGWTTTTPPVATCTLPVDVTAGFRLEVVPPRPLPVGFVGFAFSARPPKEAIIAALARQPGLDPDTLASAQDRVRSMPDQTEGYTDATFSLTEAEGFYPLGFDAWTDYWPQLGPKGGLGAVYWRDPNRTPEQAREIVDLFGRLQRVMQADPDFAETLADAGIDVQNKRQEYLEAAYTLAVDAFRRADGKTARQWLEAFAAESTQVPKGMLLPLIIAAGNLQALVAWSEGDRKQAEQRFRDAFYLDRRHPIQRYVLRNLALFYVDRGDRDLARQMFRLALDLKPGYTALSKEAAALE